MSCVNSGTVLRLIFMITPKGVSYGYIQSSGKLSSMKNSFVGIMVKNDLAQQAVDVHHIHLAGTARRCHALFAVTGSLGCCHSAAAYS